MKNQYLNLLEKMYLEHADPVKSVPMKKYMKNQFEFLGISSAPRKEIYREFFRINGIPAAGEAVRLVRELWAQPEREYQYFGMTLLQKMEKKFTPDILPLYDFIITEKSWWDTVDFIAANLAGALLKRHREETGRVVREWVDSGNMWLRRTAILFQLKYRGDTHSELLFSLCREMADRDEFFIRKAIGWALREFSKTDPSSVSHFVDSTTLSPLSKKEAMRIILKKGLLH